MKWMLIILTVLAASPVAMAQEEVEVDEAWGSAPINLANARAVALADALREAVRIGAGVDIASQTRVIDTQLDYDRIFSMSFGHVRSYTVLEEKPDALGKRLLVSVRARVGRSSPEMTDKLAIEQLIRLKGSPRLEVAIDELIEGVPPGESIAEHWFRSTALDVGLDLDTFRDSKDSSRLAERDRFYGRTRVAESRTAGMQVGADYVLRAKIRLNRATPQHKAVQDLGLMHRFELQELTMTVDIPEINRTIATHTVRMPPSNVPATDPRYAASVFLGAALAGTDGALRPIIKMLVEWSVEMDLGARRLMEFGRIREDELNELMRALGENEFMTTAEVREFDSLGLSRVEVESRLKHQALGEFVLKVLQGRFQTDYMTPRMLVFRRTDGTDMVAPLPPQTNTLVETTNTIASAPKKWSWPPWAIPAGLMALLIPMVVMAARRLLHR